MLRTLLLSLSFLALPVFAAPTTNLIFGDSLSDEGRIYQLMDHTFPASPYFEGRYSNGPLWSEYIQGPRQNFAYAGAKTDRGNVLTEQLGSVVDNTGLKSQLDEYFDSQPDLSALSTTRVIINIGANDFLKLIESEEPSVEDIQEVIQHAVDNIITAAQSLEAAGALPENITLIGLPNLSLIPLVKGFNGPQKRLMGVASKQFNYALQKAGTDLGYKIFDTYHFTNQIIHSPRLHGFKNVEDACFDKATGTVCAEPETYFFWDEVHPTSTAHRILAAKL